MVHISLIHPSRGRPEKAIETYNYWMSKVSGDHKIEHILSLDFSDPYYKNYSRPDKYVISKNENVVQATNEAAKLATGDILIYLSDDFKCPNNWDNELYAALSERLNKPALLKVDDCLQGFETAVLTIPIMTKSLYEKLKYFWHPGYKSMFVDEDLYWTCEKNGWLSLAPWLKFPHEHCSVGKAERDETYIRSEANWDQGKTFFAERKALNFPL